MRAILELARRFGEPPVAMAFLAESEGFSRKYLHTLLTALKSAGLVRSVRGVGGGFVLAQPPGEIRLNEVLEALEGPSSLVACVADGRTCDKTNGCDARRVWQDLSNTIENALASVTLEELISDGSAADPGYGGKNKRSSRGKPSVKGR